MDRIKINFVCHGNICRSPVAEYVFRKYAEDARIDAEVCSRATHTDEIWNGVGSHIYPPMKALLEADGIECDDKRAQLLHKSDYDNFDLFLGMDSENVACMRRLFDGDKKGKVKLLSEYAESFKGEIEDPWYTRNFQKVYNQICEGCRGLTEVIRHEQ